MQRARLITIGFSHFCEKARWALDRVEFDYVEEPHLPVLHWAASFGTGGRRTVPVLVVDGRVLSDSSDIVGYLAERAPRDARLYPSDPTARQTALKLEDLFDRRLGPATRRIAYFHVLPHKAAFIELAQDPKIAPRWERALGEPLYPVLAAMLRRGLKIDEAGVERSRRAVTEVFSDVEARLGDGRRYLCGDEFTVADLTFASLAAPVVLPPEYGAPFPSPEQVPALAELIAEYRATAAGKFALRLYAEDRRRIVN